MNINSNTVLFASVATHQKKVSDFVVYSPCPTNGPYKKIINSYCLHSNYVTKPLRVLQRVKKNKKLCIWFRHSKT